MLTDDGIRTGKQSIAGVVVGGAAAGGPRAFGLERVALHSVDRDAKKFGYLVHRQIALRIRCHARDYTPHPVAKAAAIITGDGPAPEP